MDLAKIASKAPNYIRRFGLIHGLRLLSRIERDLPPTSDVIRAVRVPGYAAPIHLRDCMGDHAIFWQCIVREQYDFGQFPQAGRLLAAYHAALDAGQTPLVIDCGGNVGLATLWLAKALPEARICVVEPDPDNFAVLKRNIACLGDRVVAVHGGVWRESGHLRIVNPESGPTARRVAVDEVPTAGSIRAYSIPELCELAAAASPFIVKIDIEGAQKDLFERNTQWVEQTHLITLELDDWLFPWQGTSRAFISCLSRYAFEYLLAGESIFCFQDFDAERPRRSPLP